MVRVRRGTERVSGRFTALFAISRSRITERAASIGKKRAAGSRSGRQRPGGSQRQPCTAWGMKGERGDPMGPPGVSRALPEAPCRCGRRRKPACASARARRCSRLPPLPDPLRRPSSPPQRRPRHGPRREQEQRQGGAAERQEDHREWARPRQRRAAAGGARPSASRRVAAPACCWPRAHSPSHWAASGCLPVRSALCSCAALDRCQRLLACCSWARAAYTPVSTLAPPLPTPTRTRTRTHSPPR